LPNVRYREVAVRAGTTFVNQDRLQRGLTVLAQTIGGHALL
jgi:hypothetical protein